MSNPLICFGQQPCGFFPKRFLWAKVATARRLQREIGGEIVFFYHDSDHDPRETRTILRRRSDGQPVRLNFSFANEIQRRWSPLYVKRVVPGWVAETARQLPAYAEKRAADLLRSVAAGTVADFCLEMYRGMGLLEGVRVVRSSDPEVRRAACPVDDFFVDVPHAGEIVRARCSGGTLRLHEGGDHYIELPAAAFGADQVSPARDTRFRWMQAAVRCTHYVAGAGEQAYLHVEEAPEVTFLKRDPIDRSDEAFTEIQC
jgi:hypothetical protein